jgi:hypothetical protein
MNNASIHLVLIDIFMYVKASKDWSKIVCLFHIWFYPLYIVEVTLLHFDNFDVFIDFGIWNYFLRIGSAPTSSRVLPAVISSFVGSTYIQKREHMCRWLEYIVRASDFCVPPWCLTLTFCVVLQRFCIFWIFFIFWIFPTQFACYPWVVRTSAVLARLLLQCSGSSLPMSPWLLLSLPTSRPHHPHPVTKIFGIIQFQFRYSRPQFL